MANHKYAVHEDCHIDYCMICEGGLAVCEICGGLEGALPTDCPETRMTKDQIDQTYEGKLDFQNGKWIKNQASIYSPAYYRNKFNGQQTGKNS